MNPLLEALKQLPRQRGTFLDQLTPEQFKSWREIKAQYLAGQLPYSINAVYKTFVKVFGVQVGRSAFTEALQRSEDKDVRRPQRREPDSPPTC